MYGTGFRGRARGRGRDGGARSLTRRVCPCSRSTSRRGSTARPARSRRGRAGATRRSASRRYKPGLLFEPGRAHAGRVVRGRHRDRRRRPVRSSRCSTSTDLALPAAGPNRTSGRRVVSWWAVRAGWWARRCSRAAPRSVAARAWSCARCPAPAAAAQISGRELVARSTCPRRRTARSTKTPRSGARRSRALPRAGDRARARPRPRHPGRGAPDRRGGRTSRSSSMPTRSMRSRSILPRCARDAAGFPPAVLTPHAAEYERLAGRPVGRRSRGGRARARAALRAIVLLKGPGTVIARPTAHAW